MTIGAEMILTLTNPNPRETQYHVLTRYRPGRPDTGFEVFILYMTINHCIYTCIHPFNIIKMFLHCSISHISAMNSLITMPHILFRDVQRTMMSQLEAWQLISHMAHSS